MLLYPETTKAITEAIAARLATRDPKSSAAKIVAAMGVLAAPARTATKPIQLKSTGSRLKIEAKVAPDAAPIKSVGVTTPPLPPAPLVKPVNSDFQKNANLGIS